MTVKGKLALGAAVAALAAGGGTLAHVVHHGVSARDTPSFVEEWLARRMRHLAIPRAAREAKNPMPLTPEILEDGRHHWADHCAICHGNDGKGQTEIGRNLYPKAPDMTLPETQDLSDGELFWIIHNGVRLTGMPAWGSGDAAEDRDSWELVHFIRHLPKLTPEELEAMKAMNPKSREEWEQEEAERRFLAGEDPAPPPAHDPRSHKH